MTWKDTNGAKPKTGDKLLRVKFRNGQESTYTYTARSLPRWTHNGGDWDVVAWRPE